MNELEEKYQLVLEESKNNKDVLGLFLGGSRGKSDEFLTKDSDMDVYVILSDNTTDELKEKLKVYGDSWFEIRVLTLSEFTRYAEFGSDKDWDRYNFSHNKAIVDKTGEIQKLMDEKGTLPENIRGELIEESIDAYLNQVYRSAKYWRDGKNLSAYIDATESLPFLMTALYALESRLKPYNKYFEWELKNHPLKLLPWKVDEFISDYKHILETGDIKTQQKIFKEVKKLFINQGFGDIFEEWKEYYFVGKI
jgi:hypothetical protein